MNQGEILDFSCPRKEIVGADGLTESGNDDRKIMQFIRITKRLPRRKKKRSECIWFR